MTLCSPAPSAARSHEQPVGAVEALLPGQRKLVFRAGRSAIVFNVEGRLHAIDNACPHGASALSGGRLDGCVLSCPAHGLRFDIRTGRIAGATGGVGLAVDTFAVRIEDGQAFMSTLPSSAPPPSPKQ